MVALDDVSLALRPGEIAAVVGENGAGKSTLMNVLSGLYRPDEGEILIDGSSVSFSSPAEAIRRGIGMVHQHFTLIPSLSVLENVILGNEPRRRGLLDLPSSAAQVQETCRKLGFALDPWERVENLSVGSRQKLEIVKVLHRGAQVLILDEPTAVLTPQECEELFATMRTLASAGRTIVFVTHKLREVLAVSDRIVVMRRGQAVAEVSSEKMSEDRLTSLILGSASSVQRPAPEVPVAGPPLLDARNLQGQDDDGRPVLKGTTLHLRGGEIVGIAGVDGNGQRELVEVLTGLRPSTGGEARVMGTSLLDMPPAALRRMGMGHIPEDRHVRGMVDRMTVEENVALGRQDKPPFASRALIDFRGRRARAGKLLADFDVRPPDPRARIGQLSGGNQQKVVVARELDSNPRLLIVVQPTRGLDFAATNLVHQRLRDARQRGAGIILISLDLDELFQLSDRIYVLFGGAITAEMSRSDFDQKRIGSLMLGGRGEAQALGAPH